MSISFVMMLKMGKFLYESISFVERRFLILVLRLWHVKYSIMDFISVESDWLIFEVVLIS